MVDLGDLADKLSSCKVTPAEQESSDDTVTLQNTSAPPSDKGDICPDGKNDHAEAFKISGTLLLKRDPSARRTSQKRIERICQSYEDLPHFSLEANISFHIPRYNLLFYIPSGVVPVNTQREKDALSYEVSTQLYENLLKGGWAHIEALNFMANHSATISGNSNAYIEWESNRALPPAHQLDFQVKGQPLVYAGQGLMSLFITVLVPNVCETVMPEDFLDAADSAFGKFGRSCELWQQVQKPIGDGLQICLRNYVIVVLLYDPDDPVFEGKELKSFASLPRSLRYKGINHKIYHVGNLPE